MSTVNSKATAEGMANGRAVFRERPDRWDHPLDPEMLERDVSWLLTAPPFNQLNPRAFEAVGSLEQILRHDSRILRFEPGDLIVREGDYGSSAFIVLRGSVRAFLVSLWAQQTTDSNTLLEATWGRFKEWFLKNPPENSTGKPPKKGDPPGDSNRREGARNGATRNAPSPPQQQIEQVEGRNRIFLQDIEGIIQDFQSESLGVGSLFGELAAITRTPHRFTVVAEAPTVVLEIRWQGLRLLRRDAGFSEYLSQRYRQSGLQKHLRETPIFRFLTEESIQKVVDATKLDSFGDMEWFADYKTLADRDMNERIGTEPLIAEEGTEAKDLFLIRAGFARVSFEHGGGHQTLAYLGRGQMFGLEEISHRFLHPGDRAVPYQTSLRALGFVDVLRIPAETCFASVLQQVRKSELPTLKKPFRYDHNGRVPPDVHGLQGGTPLDTSLIEFLVDERIMNGRRTMVIDLDRCTGCDDCVKACATTHGGIPRFVRTGPQFGSLMFSHACMHCVDPVCMIGCPTGAIGRNPDTGVIAIQTDICIGCRTCAESCPYENIVMLQAKDTKGRSLHDQATGLPILQASKCDLCQKLPFGPACQQACPHNALFRVDTSEVDSLANWFQKGRGER